jgi:ADP-heptose:LPS heptosyltransferase
LKILIIRFSSIGDIVLTSPVIRCLKNQLPQNSQVHYLTKPSFESLLNENPYCDRLWLLKPSLNETINEIKAQKFDYIIDLHNNLRTFIIKKRCAVPSFSFDKLNFKKFLVTRFKINKLPQIHIVDRYFKTIDKLGVINDEEGLDYFFPAKEDTIYQKAKDLKGLNFISMAIGGQHSTKKMPVHKLKEIVTASNYKIAVLGGKEDVTVANELEVQFPEKVINLAGKLSLHESAGVVSLSKGIITHDTGMMHIAAALKRPVLAVWGNTIPEFGMSAYFGKHEVFVRNFEVHNLKCRPCSKLGFDKCPKGHFNCMVLQDTKAIAHSANNL